MYMSKREHILNDVNFSKNASARSKASTFKKETKGRFVGPIIEIQQEDTEINNLKCQIKCHTLPYCIGFDRTINGTICRHFANITKTVYDDGEFEAIYLKERFY